MLPLTLFLAVIVACPAAAELRSDDFAVPITVANPTSLPAVDIPLTTGVPFPPRVLRDAARLRLRSGDREVPVQTRITSRWPDGSVRWLLADWIASGGPSLGTYTLVPAGNDAPANPVPPHPVVVDERDDGLRIDTGRVRFATRGGAQTLLDEIFLDGKALAAPHFELTVDGARHGLQPAESVRILERGPVRVRIEARGRYAPDFGYVVRIDAYAGQPWLRIFHSFEQIGTRPQAALARVRLWFPAPAGDRPARAWLGRESASALEVTPPLRVQQADAQHYRHQDRLERGMLSGWLDVAPASGIAFAIVARDLWQQAPQAFEVSREAIAYDLVAADDAPLAVGVGASKTHEFVLYPHIGEHLREDELQRVMRPAVAVVDPRWLVATGAMRNALDGGDVDPMVRALVAKARDGAHRVELRNAKEVWDDAGAVRCTGEQRRRTGAYGVFHWGDWNFPGYRDDTKGCDAWGNQEYDLTQVYALAFAATGTPRLHDAMVVAARHFGDVDVIRAQPRRPEWIGMNHPKNPMHFSFELGGVDLGHTWTEGLLSYAMLSGDERGLASATGIADYLERRTREGVLAGNPRQFGWPAIALVAAYEALGDAKYQSAAQWYARRGLAAYPTPSLTEWKTGILAEAFAYVDSIGPDDALRAWLRRYAAAALASGARDVRFLPALAYVARLDGSAELAAFVRDRIERLELGSWAKPFTIGVRSGAAALSPLRGLAAPPAR